MRTASIFYCLLMFLILTSCQRGKPIVVESPARKIVVSIDLSNQVKLMVSKNGKTILSKCLLGLIVDGSNIGNQASLTGEITKRTIHEEYHLYGNHSRAINNCREILLPLKAQGINYQLLVRAYDDGVAIRYILPSVKSRKINSDNTSFYLPDSVQCYWADYADSNEELYKVSTFSGIPTNHVLVAPLTVKAGTHYLAFSEADCIDFPDMSWIKQDGSIKANFTTNPQGWLKSTGDIVSPWRLVVLADDLNQLVNSDLVTSLCSRPRAGSDFSWVKPGRVLWQWWSVGAPKFEEQKQWFDAAARLGWEYYLIDDGWRVWRKPEKDQWQCLKEVIDYGNSLGVKSLVWVDSKEMRNKTDLQSYLKKVKEVGAKGVKIDFIPPPTPEIMQWYQTVREETYNLQLMCNFHGCIKPTGLNRTWPHEMTREGVRGNEYQMTRYNRLRPLGQDEIIPFTRLVIGPADFTPVIFDEKELRGYTWSHELAQAVVYNSPLTHFADDYRNYLNNPAEDVLKDIPVVWDETLVLPCSEIGKAAAFAKRKGNEWWIGILNGKEQTNLSFDLDFISGDVNALVLSDKDNVYNAFIREERTINKGERISIRLQPGGGYLMRLKNSK